jgi:hypothetical protein
MIFLIPLLTRAVLVGSGVVLAKSVYDRTRIQRERLELERERAGSTPPPVKPNESEEK